MTKHLIASGILTWEGQERRSDRYGSVHMTAEPYNGPGEGEAAVVYDKERLASLEGQKVRLTCKVAATRHAAKWTCRRPYPWHHAQHTGTVRY